MQVIPYHATMSNHLLPKTYFDLIVDTFFEGPKDARDWSIEIDDSPENTGQDLVRENLRATAWHRLWSIVYKSLEHPPETDKHKTDSAARDTVMLRASAISAHYMDNPYVLAELFDDEEINWRRHYEFTPRTLRLSCTQLISLLDTWHYNSCEHLTWQDPTPVVELISGVHLGVSWVKSSAVMAAPDVPADEAQAYNDKTAVPR